MPIVGAVLAILALMAFGARRATGGPETQATFIALAALAAFAAFVGGPPALAATGMLASGRWLILAGLSALVAIVSGMAWLLLGVATAALWTGARPGQDGLTLVSRWNELAILATLILGASGGAAMLATFGCLLAAAFAPARP